MTIVHRARSRSIRPVRIACINKATVDLGIPLEKLTAALQKCYDEHFLPVWGYPVELYVAKTPKPTDWRFYYLDDSGDDEAYGLHDLTEDGQPISKVFVKDTLGDGELVSVTASHELFEMAIDPIANLWADAADGTQYAYEMCDAVEEDTFKVDGIEMSNFVYPAWFEPFRHPPGTKFDHLGLLKKPFSLRKGGYAIVDKNGKVREKYGSKAKRKRFQLEKRTDHRSEYRKPNKKALLTKHSASQKHKKR